MRPSFPYHKKESQNTESTSFYSQKSQNKVLSTQKSSSRKLSQFLYQGTEVQNRPKSNSYFQNPTDFAKRKPLEPKADEDPFIKAKLMFMVKQSDRHVVQRKVGRLYDELNMQSSEDSEVTTLKREQVQEHREQDVSIRCLLAQRNRK